MNSISDIFDQYAQVKPNIMTMPYKESFELALCKTGFSIYRINLGKEGTTKSRARSPATARIYHD